MDIILLRHSDREEIKSVKGFFDAKLTEEGVIKSREAGRELAEKYNSIAISSSIIKRCFNTGVEIGKGFSEKGKKVRGVIVPYEEKRVFMAFVKNPFEKLKKNKKPVIDHYGGDYFKMLKGWEKLEVEELISVKEVYERDMKAIDDIRKIYSEVEALIVITHDVIISAFSMVVEKQKERRYFKPGYLEGLILNEEGWKRIKLGKNFST